MTDNSLPKPVPKTLPAPSNDHLLDDSSTQSAPALPLSNDGGLKSASQQPQNSSPSPTSVPATSEPISSNLMSDPVPSSTPPVSPTPKVVPTTPPPSIFSAQNTSTVPAASKPSVPASGQSTTMPASAPQPSSFHPPSTPSGGTAAPVGVPPQAPSVSPSAAATPASTFSTTAPLGGAKPLPTQPLNTVATTSSPSVAPTATSPGEVKPLSSVPGTPPLSMRPGPTQSTPPVATAPMVAVAASSVVGSTPTVPPQSSSPVPSSPVQPQSAQPKKPPLRFLPLILLIVALIAVVGGGVWFFFNRQTEESPSTTPVVNNQTEISYWGLWEPSTVMATVIANFEAQNPGVKVNYTQQSHREYRERLQTAIASGQGPDVFRFHASWTPMMRNELSPVPDRIMTGAEFAATFYPTAVQQLSLSGRPVGMPMMYDGLGLYYNKDIFAVANKTVPKDWEEVKQTAEELTIRSGSAISRGGIALGTASNVEHFSDILGLMLLQNGADPADPTTPAGQDAAAFYTSFAQTLRVWDDTLPMATVAFSKGDVAMMIAPSWRVHEIKALNPNLNFDIAPVPQLPGAERVTWATYWAEGVSEQSRQKDLAWRFVQYLTSAEVQKLLYSEARKERAFGEIYSRTDLAGELVNEPYVAAYIEDAPYAKSWYLNGYTHDNGLNDRTIKYYQDAINASTSQGSLSTALPTVKQGVAQVLQQYGIAVAAPSSQP